MDLHAAVVVDEAEFAEFGHEKIDAAAGGPDHFGESFLGDVGDYGVGLAFFAILRQK